MTLTAAGRALLPHAQRALALAADAEEAVDRAVAGERLRLWVAAGEALGTYVLPDALAGLRERMPSLEAGFLVGDVARVLSALRAGEVDVALVTGHTAPGDIQAAEFGRDRLVLVGPEGDGAPAPPRDLDDLRRLVLVVRDRGTVNRLQVDRLLADAGVEPASRLEAFSLEAVKRCVEARLGVAVVPAVAVAGELERGSLRAIPMPALEMELSLCLAWRRGERLSPAAEALLDVLRNRWGRG